MKRWWPWLLAFIVWNGAFDLLVRRAAHRFTADQVARWDAGLPPVLIRDSLQPDVTAAAVQATGAGLLVLAASLLWTRRRRALASHR